MTLTRKQIADAIDGYDAEIAVLQESKRETYAGYREQLAEVMGRDAVKAEIEGVKAAIKRRQAVVKKGETAVEERDALIDEIFAEITASRAPRATRVEPIEEFDAESGEILDIQSRPADAPSAYEAGELSWDKARQQSEPLPAESPRATQAIEAGDSGEANSPETADDGLAGPACIPDAGTANIKPALTNSTGGRLIHAAHEMRDIARGDASPAVVTNFDPRQLRPHCLHPECCGGSGRNHCWPCQKAMNANEAVA